MWTYLNVLVTTELRLICSTIWISSQPFHDHAGRNCNAGILDKNRSFDFSRPGAGLPFDFGRCCWRLLMSSREEILEKRLWRPAKSPAWFAIRFQKLSRGFFLNSVPASSYGIEALFLVIIHSVDRTGDVRTVPVCFSRHTSDHGVLLDKHGGQDDQNRKDQSSPLKPYFLSFSARRWMAK